MIVVIVHDYVIVIVHDYVFVIAIVYVIVIGYVIVIVIVIVYDYVIVIGYVIVIVYDRGCVIQPLATPSQQTSLSHPSLRCPSSCSRHPHAARCQ